MTNSSRIPELFFTGGVKITPIRNQLNLNYYFIHLTTYAVSKLNCCKL